MKVIIINEENHGFIGVAKGMDSAFRFLIKEGWVDDLWDRKIQRYLYHTAFFEQYNVDNLFDLMKVMYEEDENAFDGLFYFSEETVFE
jgi:hypothetical protein